MYFILENNAIILCCYPKGSERDPILPAYLSYHGSRELEFSTSISFVMTNYLGNIKKYYYKKVGY